MSKLATLMNVAVATSLIGFWAGPADAVTDCTFTTVGTTQSLDADCTTDETIGIPDGFTLDGHGHSITAVDPLASHFVGPVVSNAGARASVVNLVVQAQELTNVCDGGADRLRGIMFEHASGAILQNTVQGINQGPSGCQEGNGIEVRNAPFDNTHPDIQVVEIGHNVVGDYQKTGIVCNGDVDCDIHHNFIGESATQQNLAANSVQIGFGARGKVELNHIAGNQWKGTSAYVATALLFYSNDESMIRRNNIGGNSDIGIYAFGAATVIDNNRVFDGGADDINSSYDIGLGDWGDANTVTNNKIRGFATPTDGNVDPETQKVIPSPNEPPEVCFGTVC